MRKMYFIGLADLRDSTKNQGLTSCADAEHLCNSGQHQVVRMWCPQTCGCDSIASGLFLWKAKDGCSPSCYRKTSYKEPLNHAPCLDRPRSSLTKTGVWKRYAKGVDDATRSW